MNKRGIKYFLSGRKSSAKVFKTNFSMYFKYWVFVIASILARVSIVFYPFMEQARYNLISNLDKTNNINVDELLNGFEKPKKLWDLFLVFIVRVVIITSGLFLFKVISTLLWTLGLEIESMFSIDLTLFNEIPFIPGLLMIPMALISIIFTIAVLVKNDLTSFITVSEELNAKESFVLTNKLYNRKTFKKLFSIYLFAFLDIVIKLAIALGIVVLTDYLFGNVVSLGFAIVLVIVLLFLLVRTFLTLDISRFNLMKDLLKTYEDLEEDENVNVSEQEMLITLFDENSEGI